MQAKLLTVEVREGKGKGAARQARFAGKVPGVMYGAGEKPSNVQVDGKVLKELVKAGAHHGLLDVSLAGGAAIKALMREIQVHPVTRDYVHIDLQRISMTEKIRLNVQVVLDGKPEGVKTHGGILEQVLRSVEIECLPADIPHELIINVAALNVGQAIHISDLSAPGVTFLGAPDAPVATVTMPAAERSSETAATAEAAATAAAATAAAPAADAKGAAAGGKAAPAAKAAPGKAAPAAKAAAKPAAKPAKK